MEWSLPILHTTRLQNFAGKGDMALAGMACISSIESQIKAADPGTPPCSLARHHPPRSQYATLSAKPKAVKLTFYMKERKHGEKPTYFGANSTCCYLQSLKHIGSYTRKVEPLSSPRKALLRVQEPAIIESQSKRLRGLLNQACPRSAFLTTDSITVCDSDR